MMKSKKNIAKMILVAFVLSLVLPAGAFAADTKTASDLSGHWAQATIGQWMDKGLIGGYADGTFRPDQAITRAEFVKLVNKAIGAKTTGAVTFSDVSENDWFYGELQLAMGAGYVGGFEDGTFRPNDTVTRAQAAAFIVKAKQLPADVQAAGRFTDQGAIADWAKGAVGAAAKAGYIGGYQDGTFQADKALTRAEAVSMLDRVMQAADKAKDEQKPAVSGGGSSSSGGSSSGGSGGGGGGGSTTDKDDINTTELSYDASAGALTVKAGNPVIDKNALNGVASVKTLTVNDGVASVTIDGITVTGATTINGGGSNSVHFKNCQLQGTVALSSKEDVHVSLEGGTTVAQAIVVNQPAILSVENATISQPVEAKNDLTLRAGTVPAVKVLAEATVAAEADSSAAVTNVSIETTAPVTVAAPTETVVVAQANEAVTLESDVQTVKVNEAATVSVAEKATVTDLQANAAMTVNGAGNVTSATVATTAPVTVAAPTEKVVVAQASEAVTLESNVQTVEVNAATTVSVAQTATVTDLQAKAATAVEGAGNVTSATVATTAPVAIGAKTDTVNVSTAEAQVTVDAEVSNVNVSEKATITVETGAKVETIASTATGENAVTVTGSGDVQEVIATDKEAVKVDDSVNGEGTAAPTVEQAYKITTVVKNLKGTAVANAATTTLPNVAKKSTSVSFTAAAKAGYELISVVEGENPLTVENSKYTFTMGEKDATVTITVAEQPQWQAVPAGVSATAVAQNGTAYTTTLSGTTTAAIENGQGQLFAGVDNTNNKFAQCVLNLGGLKASTTYTVEQVNKALNEAYPGGFTDNTKTKTYTGEALAEGLAVLVWQGDANTITLTIKDGETTVRTITITNKTTAAPVAVTGVTLDKSTLTLAVGGQATLTATVEPAKATNKAVTWSSDNTAVATVTDKGAVTAVSAGTATITVTTADGGKTATCTVTVKGAPQATVTPGEGLTITDKTISGNFTGTLDAAMFGTANQNADLGQLVITFSNLEDDQQYTIKQTNHALSAAYPDEFKDNVKTKDNYTKDDLADGLYVLVLHGDTNDITIELSATGDTAVLQTLTLSNATTATTEATVKDLAELTAALAKDKLTTITLADKAEIAAIQGTAVGIPKGKTLVIPAGASLSGAEYITNNGTLVVNDAAGLALGASVGGNITLGSHITLTDAIGKNGVAFEGTLDGAGYSIDFSAVNGADYGVFAADTTGDTTIKNVTLQPGLDSVEYFIYMAGGTAFTYENVIVGEKGQVCRMKKAENNESVYLAHSRAVTTTFKDCTNNLSYTNEAAKSYNSAFLGGYAYGACTHLTFENCTNNGNLTMDYPAVYVGNGANMENVNIAIENCVNNGQITGTANAAYVGAISHAKLKTYDGVDIEEIAKTNTKGSGKVEIREATWLKINQDESSGELTVANSDSVQPAKYNVSFSALARGTNGTILLNHVVPVTDLESKVTAYQMIDQKTAGNLVDADTKWTDFGAYGVTYIVLEESKCVVFNLTNCTSGNDYTLNVAQPEVTVTAVDSAGNPLGMAKLTYTATPAPITPKEKAEVNEKEAAEKEVPQEPQAPTTDNDSVQTGQTDDSTSTTVDNPPAGPTDDATTVPDEPTTEEGGTSEQLAE